MKRYQIIATTLLAFLITFAGCGFKDDTNNADMSDQSNAVDSETPEVKSLLELIGPEKEITSYISSLNLAADDFAMAEKGNAFSYSLASSLYKGENFVISPLGLQFLLGMLHDCSSGNTALEIRKTLGVEQSEEEFIGGYYKKLIQSLPCLDEFATLSISNACLINDKFQVSPYFRKVAAENFYAAVQEMDFTDPDKVKEIINLWCDLHTNGLIPSLIEDSSLISGSMAVLLNALYFKGPWGNAFPKANTLTLPFMGNGSKQKDITFMRQKEIFPVYEDSDLSALSIPIGGGNYQMTFILPSEGKTVEDILKVLAGGKVDITLESKSIPVDLFLPKYQIESTIRFGNVLKALGIEKMFSENTEITRILSSEALVISEILQKAKVEIDETGIEAASATALISETESGESTTPEYKTIAFNRPFIFSINEKESGLVLFNGVYSASEN